MQNVSVTPNNEFPTPLPSYLMPRDDDWDEEEEGDEEDDWEPSTCNVCGTETEEENCHMCKIGTTVEPIPWIEYQDGLDG